MILRDKKMKDLSFMNHRFFFNVGTYLHNFILQLMLAEGWIQGPGIIW